MNNRKDADQAVLDINFLLLQELPRLVTWLRWKHIPEQEWDDLIGCLQEKALTHRQSIERADNPAAYIRRILRNLVNDWMRRKDAHEVVSLDALSDAGRQIADDVDVPEEVILHLRQEAMLRLQELTDQIGEERLEPALWELFRAYMQSDEVTARDRLRQAGSTLGLDEATAKSVFFRARGELRSFLIQLSLLDRQLLADLVLLEIVEPETLISISRVQPQASSPP